MICIYWLTYYLQIKKKKGNGWGRTGDLHKEDQEKGMSGNVLSQVVQIYLFSILCLTSQKFLFLPVSWKRYQFRDTVLSFEAPNCTTRVSLSSHSSVCSVKSNHHDWVIDCHWLLKLAWLWLKSIAFSSIIGCKSWLSPLTICLAFQAPLH